MSMDKLKNVAGVFLISAMLHGQSAEAQSFSTQQDYSDLIDCELVDDGKVNAEFLGALDSRIHGYAENLYEMTPEEREPYVQAAIDKNASHPARFIRAMFEGPYRQYAALKTEEERVEFLSERLDKFHHIEPDDLSDLAASCE